MNSWNSTGAQAYLDYSEKDGAQSDVRKFVLKDFDFSPSDEVLDVGCGPGTACGEIATRVKSVTGIDLSPGMISVANRKHAATNVDFVVADAHYFGQGWKEKFDKIICICVLHWCKDQQRVLQNIFSCLKPGGRFLLWFNLQSQLLSKSCKYGETADTWLRDHPKWGLYLTPNLCKLLKEKILSTPLQIAMNAWDVIGAQAYLDISEDGGIQSDVRNLVFKDFDFNPSDEVLDVGCGPGTACGEIATRVKSVTGFDLSPGMISVANRKHAAPNVDFVVADAHYFGQGCEEKFDKIICLCVLHWCRDQKRVLQNIFRCLKPGGRFLLWFPLQSQLVSKRCKYGETGDTWLRAHQKWGPYLTV
ncbi:uncharacterized protein [Diadema antillarum]|uniref:uncharacterized protein n=1 Tax=Diadema antillarum TaxID=105358 RepID=UPI003A83A45F